MKKFLLIFILSVYTTGFAQTISVVNITTNDIVYSTYNSKLYATVPSANGTNGNSIGRINPLTAALEGTTPIGSEPSVMAISSDGQTIYCGFNGTSTVRKFNTTNNTASTQFSLGSDTYSGAFYAEDIEVMPNNPNTIAVARRNLGYSPKHEGVAIYDNGIMRATTTPDHSGSNQIEFDDEFSLVGYNNESTEYGFRRMSINAGGVTETSLSRSLVHGFGLNFSAYNKKAFFTNGTVIDFNFSPFVSGTFSNANGPTIYDTFTGLVCIASNDANGAITFKRYNPETYLLVDSLPIPQANGQAKNITVCGNGCYAFNTTNNKVIIIKNFLNLNSEEFKAKSSLSLYPNPVSSTLSFSHDNTLNIEKVEIYSSIGQKIKTLERNDITISHLEVSDLTAGIYFADIFTNEGKITKKFIKK
ncbi:MULTISPECIES: T9SS type A sorting domain-containing protein [Flavobacterium]|uniref:T9SS type A sorting domain-containing protein n=1 Tax=Flavobacterium TaxID=237 RepID=UPI001FCB4103|nr:MULTISPECIES: T9SS type A sorting domain-containing protein [Flavobacterium]UOK41531.1 T9SS type A sorting domain-containing protein [Flavobacterium enshiense]